MIGLSTLAFTDVYLDEALDEIEGLCDHAEIFSDKKHDLFPDPDILSSFDLSYSIHAPTMDINIASVRETTRQASVSILTDIAEICMSVDARVMVIHPGYTSDPALFPEAYAALSRSLEEIGKTAADTGVSVCLENMPGDEMFLFRHPADVSPEEYGIGFALDVGHAHINGVLGDFCARKIDHFHIHDNSGIADEHAAVGEGTIDISDLCETFRSSNALLIAENKTREQALRTLEALKAMGLR